MNHSHKLFAKLIEVNNEAARLFPADYDQGFGGIGLILMRELRNGGYDCTPKNSYSFAGTGGDGVHFSFVTEHGEVTNNSPVVVTIPMAFKHPNFIVGENLYDFLCLGIYRGYFALEQLGYKLDETLTAYADATWQPTTRDHAWVGLGNDDRKQELLPFLTEQLGLVPWRNTKAKFDLLQKTWLGKLEVPPEAVW